MAGVNRANVAVTDTFDTWRIRTNEVNTTLNQGTNAITANTIVFRDDNSSYVANAATLNTVSITHGTTTTALSVTSALAAASDGTKASILTTGGIYATLTSKFAADLTVDTDMTINGNTVIGSASGDIATFNATLTGNVVPTTNVSADSGVSAGSMLGSTAKNFAHIFNSQQTITAASGITANVFSVTSAAGAGNTATIVNNGLTTGTPLTVASTSTDTTARKLVQITNDADAAVATTALSIQSDAGRGIFVDSNLAAGLPSLQIDSEHTTANAVIVDSIMTTGTIVDVTGSALTSGSALRVESTGASAGTRNVVDFRQEHASATGSTVLNVLADEGFGVKITSTAATSNASLDITSSHTTKNTFNITAGSLTTGSALHIDSDSSSTSTRSIATIIQNHASAVAATALTVQSDGGRGVFIDSNLAAGLPSLEIDSEHTSANTIQIASDVLTTGSALTVTSAGTHSSNLVSFISDGAATGPTLHLRSDATATATKIFQVANSSADVFSVTQAGDATIGNDLTIAGDFVVTGNLSVSGATSEINTTTTVVKDHTLVLGTQSAVTAGATYTAATPPVVTSASHGLSTGNIIFLVTATGTGLTSSQTTTFAENIVKVTVTDGNTFTLADKDGTNIVSNSTGTISWVGPQTDALIDDAGIYVPGDTGVHKIKWDDTDNYWEVNASFNIDDTGQFVLPKGTSAQKPAAAIVGNIPAATTGALRYNTDNSKIEGVTVGTTYENISTETFATAIAIALG